MTAEKFFNKAINAEEEEDFSSAKVFINRAIELDSSHSSLFLERGVINIELDLRSEALSDYHKAIALDPYNTSAYFYIGNLYSIKKEDSLAVVWYSRAIEQIENSSKIQFENMVGEKSIDDGIVVHKDEILYYRGISQYNIGRDSMALVDLLYAEKMNFRKEDAQLYIGLLLYKYNKKEGCKYLVKSANNGNQDAFSYIKELCK